MVQIREQQLSLIGQLRGYSGHVGLLRWCGTIVASKVAIS
jgi:hypothetical protein